MLSLCQCLGGLHRPVINDGCSSFFPLVSFVFSFFLSFFPTQSNCMYSSKPLFIMIRIHTLMLCDDGGSGWSDLYVELLTKNNVRINDLYFSKRPLLRFRSQENCSKLINVIVTTTSSTPHRHRTLFLLQNARPVFFSQKSTSLSIPLWPQLRVI